MRAIKKALLVFITAILIASAIPGIRGSATSGTHAAYSAPGAGYIGMSLPANFVSFNSASPWNTPIPANPQIDPNSPAIIANLKATAQTLKANVTSWTIPLFVIDSTTSPKRDVKTTAQNINPLVDPMNTGVARGIPIPEGVWPDPGGDGHMLLVDPTARKTWDLSRAKRLSDGSWTASMIYFWDLNGSGYATPFSGNIWWTIGARGSGMPLVAGLIRPEEIAAGAINHALVAATPINRQSLDPSIRWQLCSPAARTDGNLVGNQYILEGARLQLDPTLNLNALGLSPATKTVALAMQKYGMFIGDNSSDFNIYFQNIGPSANNNAWNQYGYFSDIGKIPVNEFRVIPCNVVTKI